MFHFSSDKSFITAYILFLPLLFLQFLFSPAIQAQTVTGTVYDAVTEEPLQDAAIYQHGTTRGVTSGEDGSFEIQLLENEERSLIITFIGYENQLIELDGTDQNLEVFLNRTTYIGSDVFVSATRVDETTPVTYTNINREEIEGRNLGQDIPYLLQNTPSVVTTSDAGAGIGYTGIRIRGVDPNRINVTINGIPVNNPESHGTFWVNLPDLSSSTENIQIQRGVGTSTNGAGAFGATINLQTSSATADPFGEINTGFGSFNTRKYNVKLGSGRMENGWQFEGRLSKIDSDGFVDRASSDLGSWFLSASHHGERSLLQADVFSGRETTYQAWYGVEESMLEENRTYNEAGTEKTGDPYDNQSDNYQQNYYQLHYSYQLQDNWIGNISAFYTRGFGYYEEYKAQQSLADYGMDPVLSTTPDESDLIRRRWLDNDFYGAIFSTRYDHSDIWNITVGGGYNYYKGGHFGEVIWARYAGNSEMEDRYYDNDGIKHDGNIYTKLQYQVGDRLNTYLDLQVRNVSYEFQGNGFIRSSSASTERDSLVTVQQTENLTFFNPKAGLIYNLPNNQRIYTSVGLAGKEPTRDEYVHSTPESRPSPEKLYNVEIGYRGDFSNWFAGANIYGMYYKDQLVPTGAINDTGEIVRENVPDSYRIGLELDAGISLSRNFSLSANATISENKIVRYTQYTDMYDANFNYIGQQAAEYRNNDIAFSPAVTASGIMGYQTGNLNAELVSRYVSRQYMDGTQTASRSIDPYFVNDLRLSYLIDGITLLNGVTATLMVNNLFNRRYESNGYTFGWIEDGQPVHYNYYFPQAGTNFLFQLTWSF